MKSIRYLAVFLCTSILLLNLKICEAVSRKEVSEHVYKNTLLLFVKNAAPNNKESSGSVLQKKAKQVSDTIYSLPDSEVDKMLAEWIEQSWSDLLSNRASLLVQESPRADSLLLSMTEEAKKRFAELTKEKTVELQAKSVSLMRQANVYREKRDQLIIDKFSDVNTFKIQVGDAAVVGDSDFTRVLASLDLGLRPQSIANGRSANIVDLTHNQIDSRILTLAFLRAIKRYSVKDDRGNVISYTNIISPILYDDSFKVGNFESLKPRIEALFIRAVRRNGDVAEMDYEDFLHFLLLSSMIYWQQDIAFPETKDKATVDNAGSAFVVFQNDRTFWKPPTMSRE